MNASRATFPCPVRGRSTTARRDRDAARRDAAESRAGRRRPCGWAVAVRHARLGEIITADVVIGADGVYSPLPARRPHGAWTGEVTMMGFQLFQLLSNLRRTVSALELRLDSSTSAPSLAHLHTLQGKILVWYEPYHGALGFPIVCTFKLGFTPQSSSACSRRQMVTRGCSRWRAKRWTLCLMPMPMVEQPSLEDWIHPQGRVLVFRSAAHPIPIGSLYSLGMAVEDAATLGKLSAHLHTTAQCRRSARRASSTSSARAKATSSRSPFLPGLPTRGTGHCASGRSGGLRCSAGAWAHTGRARR
ncbi:hypothetical protein C8Q80DRAFT_893587 [Daedaleopsis nitida]|nr:hypothetical protein C8Q80DRAFT_893587 [Daedaleopsis nitida]